jgi:hypothetical protein
MELNTNGEETTMQDAERYPVAQVVAEKRVTRLMVHEAVRAGDLNAEWFCAMRMIITDETYEPWQPNCNRQRAQKEEAQ